MTVTGGVPERLTSFVHALRGHGVRVGPGETLDAGAVVAVLGLEHRERLRAGLASALLRGEGQRAVFDATFDLYFPLRVGAPQGESSVAELRERLAEALAANDRAALAGLAAEAVQALGQFGNPPGSGGWSAAQTLDRLRPQTLLARVLAGQRQGRSVPEFTDRLEAEEIRRRIGAFRAQVGTEARRRAAELSGTDEIARRAVAPSVDRTDFLFANQAQLAELRRTVQPLARKLATRLAARRRRAARGQIDLRRTLRRSLSTGGVPLRPAYRRRRPQRPELVLLCDVSSSVAGFTDFTMLLVQALRDQFSKVRVFAFVNRTDEVTDGDLARATVTGHHPYSDYGTALGEFTERYLEAVTPRTAVLILGDARNNRRDPNLPALKLIADRARRVYWLNPEPPALWSTGDSAAAEYAGVVTMRPCRNARQLGQFIERLLPT
ncbi:vWA domain-containing protein [Kitasatospora azatica]|uniref:vWA domain-containing protein n=1 Tax=Kitasatospora azatica TaxID=58347 RepID=UPI000AB2C5CA|nr:VWA domain-containing protein [Kitasatospora azatica]